MSHVDEGALHSYLDGELPPAERAALEAHVAECAACRGRLAEERALVTRASELLGLAQPPERAAPPLHQLRKSRVWWQMKVPLAWAASVVLALTIGYYAGGVSERTASVAHLEDSNVIAATAPAADPPVAAPRPTTQRAAEQPATRHEEVANAVANKTQTDSLSLAAGMVAIAPPPASELRRAAPTPVPNVSVRSASGEADLASLRGRQVTTEWPIIRREPAREILGTDPVGVPGLAVREIRRSPTGDGTVLVEQQLDSSTVIQLFQRPATAERADARGFAFDRAAPAVAKEHAAADRLARFVGRLRVEIAGPLTQDSLNRLLEQVKPLP